MADVVLGFDSIEEYLNSNEVFHGTLISRVGNRIANGKFILSCGTNYLTRQAFIDWFISVPAKITRSGLQMELKLFSLSRESGNIIFTKPTGKSLPAGQAGLISSSKRHKKKKGGQYEDQPSSAWARYVPLV